MEQLNLGCRLSPIDLRDYKVTATSEPLPESFELDFSNIRVKSQGAVSSCVAHAMSTILEYHAKGDHELSTNFIYGIRKKLYNHEGKGMFLRDACRIVTNYGDPLLSDCPGNTEIPKVYDLASEVMDDEEAMKTAASFRTKSYYSCNSIEDIKYALVNYGPVLVSIKWYNDYKVSNGLLTGGNSKKYGYHALVCYGYNEKGFLIQNSWGKLWGCGGRFTLPYDIKISEARGLIDLDNDDYLPPKPLNPLVDFLYKGLNALINFVKRILKI